MQQGFIKYIVIIVVILAAVFLSQQAYSNGIGKTLISNATDQIQTYAAKGSNWIMASIYPKITEEVQKRGDIIKTEVNNEKEKVSENIATKISNYFSGVANSILHPGENINCPVPAPVQAPGSN